MMHFSLHDIAARFDDLEPGEVLDGFVSAFYGVGNRVLDGCGGGAGEFDEFIDWIIHVFSLLHRDRQARMGGGVISF